MRAVITRLDAVGRHTRVLFLVTCVSLAGLLVACAPAGGLHFARGPVQRQRSDQHSAPRPFDLMPGVPDSEADPPSPVADSEAASHGRVSPDGKWAAFELDRGGVHGVWIARRDGADARRISGVRTAVAPAWSPDASRVAFLERQARRPDAWSVWVVDIAQGRSTRFATAGIHATGVSWFPDSRRLCYAGDEGVVILDTLNGAISEFAVPIQDGRISGVPMVSPDGEWVAFAVAGDGAWVASLHDGAIKRVMAEPDADAFAWAPGGRQVAVRNARDGQWKLQVIR